MTNPSEVKISDAEAVAFYKRALLAPDEQDMQPDPGSLETVRQALAAFLARRVPDAEIEPSPYAWDYDEINMAAAHNSLRSQILSGE